MSALSRAIAAVATLLESESARTAKIDGDIKQIDIYASYGNIDRRFKVVAWVNGPLNGPADIDWKIEDDCISFTEGQLSVEFMVAA